MTTLITQYTGEEDSIRLIHEGLLSREKALGKNNISVEPGLDGTLTINENDVKRKTVMRIGMWFMMIANEYMTMSDDEYQKTQFL